MRGRQAVPSSDAGALLAEALGPRRVPRQEARDLMNLPGAHLGPSAARDCARRGRGVVVTCGTDTMEEFAMLADLLHDGEEPIVLTGAKPSRLASRRGRPGQPGRRGCRGRRARECRAGHGYCLRRRDPRRAHSDQGRRHRPHRLRLAPDRPPRAGDRRLGVARVPPAAQPLDTHRLDARVEIITAHLGADGRLLDGAAMVCEGIVAVLLGAGHCPPAFLDALVRAAELVPVVVTTRVARGGIRATPTDFRGSESDVRAGGAVVAGLLSPAAARMKLVACLGASLAPEAIRRAFADADLGSS